MSEGQTISAMRYAEYRAKRNRLHAKYWKERVPLDEEYDNKIARLDAEYWANHKPLNEEYRAKRAPLDAGYYSDCSKLREEYLRDTDEAPQRLHALLGPCPPPAENKGII